MKTKSRLYDGSIIEVEGINFKVTIEYDDCLREPWNEYDGHGPVTDWTCRDKAPGEIILHEDHGWKRYYDFQQAVKIAKRDSWNTAPFIWKTKGEQAHNAALADFRYLRDWCHDEWMFCVLTVEALDEDGDVIPYVSASLGGVEYDPRDTSFVYDEAEMLALQVIREHEGMFAKPLTAHIEPDDENEIDDLHLPDFDAAIAA